MVPRRPEKRIAERSSPVELASYLDDWALQRRAVRDKTDEASWRKLLTVAKIADRDAWRGTLRDQMGRGDQEELRRLAGDEKALETQSPPSLVLLALALKDRGERAQAEQVLQRAWRLAPGDFWVNFELGAVQRLEGSSVRPDEAVRFSSAAVALRPGSPAAHSNLGNALEDQGRLEEAMVQYHEVLRLKPKHPSAHSNLSSVLRKQGHLEEALAECRAALRIQPNNAAVHFNLSAALYYQAKLDEAIAECRTTILLAPESAVAHYLLGIECNQRGLHEEALVALRRAHELGSKYPNWGYPSAQMVETTARMVQLGEKLPSILIGAAKPKDASELPVLAQLCYYKQLYGASARFWTDAFKSQPALADDMSVQNRHNAADAAAMAGCGQGKDDPPLDEPTRARWRKQALDWLRADLAAWSKVLQRGEPHAARVCRGESPILESRSRPGRLARASRAGQAAHAGAGAVSRTLEGGRQVAGASPQPSIEIVLGPPRAPRPKRASGNVDG